MKLSKKEYIPSRLKREVQPEQQVKQSTYTAVTKLPVGKKTVLQKQKKQKLQLLQTVLLLGGKKKSPAICNKCRGSPLQNLVEELHSESISDAEIDSISKLHLANSLNPKTKTSRQSANSGKGRQKQLQKWGSGAWAILPSTSKMVMDHSSSLCPTFFEDHLVLENVSFQNPVPPTFQEYIAESSL